LGAVTRTIQVLPQELASQIAAGEVVERPASVVKELVENALDAGARRIEISIEGGGIALIEISDDGRGMSPEDAELSVERHATSKLRAFADLDSLSSYGFRGEALPSIAAVSRFSLKTRARAFDSGSALSFGSGKPTLSPVGAPIGTTISVAELFYNVPARRKFLRSTGTESSHVSDVVEGAALSRPDVAFTLKRDGRVVRSYPRASGRAERVAQILTGEALEALGGQRGPLDIQAFLSAPERARQGTAGLLLVLNGRPIKDRALAATTALAYGTLIERGRYPRGVVYLELAPHLVDVNVHPQKTEVRFADPRAVADALFNVVAQGLKNAFGEAPKTRERAPAAPVADAATKTSPSPPPATAAATPRRRSTWTHEKPVPAYVVRDVRSSDLPPESASETNESGWKRLRFLARFRGRFLACEGDDGLYLIDTRATRRLVLGAELRRDYEARSLRSQALLFPITVELGAAEVSAVEQHQELASRLGLDLRTRGTQAASLHALPSRLERVAPESVVRAFAEVLVLRDVTVDRAGLVLDRWVDLASAPEREAPSESEARALIGAFAKLELPEAERARLVLSFTSFSALLRKADEP